MAAGLGSRYGGSKQVDGIGPNNEILMEYSIYDALRAGFNKVVFIIKPEMEPLMERICGEYLRRRTALDGTPVEVAYVHQDFSSVPDFYQIPVERTKPFGTVHALLCAAKAVHEPFCVINADDYYGIDAYRAIYDELATLPENGRGAMITDYVAALKTPLMPQCDNNWKIVGADLNDPQKDLIYAKVRSGELSVPTSEDGRTPNVASLNGPALRAAGKLPALTGKDAGTTPAPATPVTAPTTTPVATPVATVGGTYTVKSGDCLWSISQQFYGTGTKWTVIYKANTAIIKNADDIQIGQVLAIPAA